MLDLDPAEMVAIAESLFVPRIETDMGRPGTDALKRLLPVIRQIHLAISTERMAKGLEIVNFLEGNDPIMDSPSQLLRNVSALTGYFDGDSPLTVQVVDEGILAWPKALENVPDREFVGYRYYRPHAEVIFTRQRKYEIPTISASASYFGIPYFRHLRESLEQYGGTWIKYSVCEIFNQAWLDDKRTVFQPRPEMLMRRSLQRHLRSGLREYTSLNVMPEQNVNETRPVDIKVTWGAFNRVGLIEIKWLGKSVNPATGSVTQNFTAGRAREGADQLVTYLDLYRREAPFEEMRGYLVVYDARRRNVRIPVEGLLPADATYYRHEEIDYERAILERVDFEHPIRYFCEPA